MGTGDGTNGVSALGARYSEAFTAYLENRGETALGAAYDLGREAVAAQLSVLDLAEAHHAALRAVTGPRRRHAARRRGLPAREPVDVRDGAPRLPGGAGGRAARARVRRAAACARGRVGRDQPVADRRGDPAAHRRRRPRHPALRPRDGRGARARPAPAPAHRHLAPAPRRRRPAARAAAGAADRPRQGARGGGADRRPRPRVHHPRRGHPHPARAARLGRDLQRPALRARAHDRAHPAALAAAGWTAAGARAERRRPLPARRRGDRARRRLLRPLRRRRRRLDRPDRRRPGQGSRRRRGHRAGPAHDARRRGLRVAAVRRAGAPAPRAARPDR